MQEAFFGKELIDSSRDHDQLSLDDDGRGLVTLPDRGGDESTIDMHDPFEFSESPTMTGHGDAMVGQRPRTSSTKEHDGGSRSSVLSMHQHAAFDDSDKDGHLDDDLNILPSDFLPQDDIMRDDDIMNLIEDITKEENAGRLRIHFCSNQ